MSENIQQIQINRILEIVEGHEHRFDAIDKRFDILSEQIQQLDKRHGERLARLEAIAEQHDQRFINMTTEIHRLVEEVHHLVDKVDNMYKWVIGLILGLTLPMWASIIIAILLKK